MAVAMYYRWEDQGRPWYPVTPISQFRTRIIAHIPAAASFIWTLGDAAHLTSNNPQDHTPFSSTGWPLPSPYKAVFAVDVSHQPQIGLNVYDLAAYWLTEARAGRMPWLKYLIWQSQRYDVRNNWAPVSAVGHTTHAHLSGRTDHENYQLGSWSPIPGDDMGTIDQPQASYLFNVSSIVGCMAQGLDSAPIQSGSGVPGNLSLIPFYDRIADAVIAKLPPDQGGSGPVNLTEQALAEIEDAAEDAVRSVLGSLDNE